MTSSSILKRFNDTHLHFVCFWLQIFKKMVFESLPVSLPGFSFFVWYEFFCASFVQTRRIHFKILTCFVIVFEIYHFQ